MVLQELFAKFGLEIDPHGFTKAAVHLGLLKAAVDEVAHVVKQAAEHLIEFVAEAAQTGAEVSKTAQKLGVSTDALQELRFAAKSAGVDTESFSTGLRLLSRQAYAASTGSGEAILAFRRVGVSVKDASGNLRPADEVLGDVAEKFSDMPDGVKKTALSMELFGRSGAEMIPFLNKGREGVADLREEAHKFGLVLDKDTIGRSKEYIKTNRELGEALEGLKLAIAGPLIQASGFKKAITAWIIANRAFIAQGIHKVVHLLGLALKGVLAVIQAVINAIRFLVEKPLGNFLLLIGAIVAAIWLLNSGLLMTGLRAVAAGVMALLPFALWAAAIAFVVLLLDELWVTLEGGDSLLNRYTGSILKMWKAWTTPKADDSNPVLFFKSFLDVMGDVTKKIPEMIRGWINMFGAARQIMSGALSDPQKMRAIGVVMTRGGDVSFEEALARIQKNAAFGPAAASPQASASALPPGAGVLLPTTPTFNTTIVAQPGQSEERIADLTRQSWQDFWDTHVRQTAATLGPVP